MRPFGQACERCPNGQDYDWPGFTDEEIRNTLIALFEEIRGKCYNDYGQSVGSKGIGDESHKTDLCEACLKGICG